MAVALPSAHAGETGQSGSGLRSVPPFFPIPKPSFDDASRKYRIGKVVYEIPRNFIFSDVDALPEQNISGISMRALLPKLSAMTAETAHCFFDRADPCRTDEITIGITAGPQFPGEKLVLGLRRLVKPEKKANDCGLEYFEERGPFGLFNFFVKKFGNEISILRCRKPNANWGPFCNSMESLGDGNSYYYVFYSKHLCRWDEI